MSAPLPFERSASSPPRILAFGVRRLKAVLLELAPDYRERARVEVLDKGFDDAVTDVRGRLAEASRGVGQPGAVPDVLVAAGSNGAFLRQRLDLPVALVKVNGFDVMRSLAHARRATPHIALVTYQHELPEWQMLNEVFGLGIVHRTYRDETEARLIVQELRERGIRAVVAPGLVADLADEAGLQGIFLYSHDAVREALDDAVEIARVARIELARRERLNTILAQLREGVVAVDMQERIETLNPAMEQLLGAPAERLLGRRLSDVAPELSLDDTLRAGRTELEAIQRVGTRMLVTSRLPITEQGRQTGAVLACQDPVTIQRVDRHLRSRQRQELQAQQRSSHATRYTLEDLVGSSPAMARTRELARRCAASDATVLIVGESGTGKELLAQGIHQASRRAGQPFVAINCAAFPEGLLESELFGYEEGAFTGSRRGGKAGLFEAAHTGTLFLDEIGDMPAALQTRLLRVLQEREILRIGATEPTPIDVRVIAATHHDLGAAARAQPAGEAGGFRRDLYYRLNILRLDLPPLRERRADLPELCERLLTKAAARLQTDAEPARQHLPQLLQHCARHDWPGNVRELENLLERLLVVGSLEAVLDTAQVPVPPATPPRLRAEREAAERDRIQAVLAACGGNRGLACQRLGISRSTLWRKLGGRSRI